MKTKGLLLCICTLVVIACSKKSKTIEYPLVGSKNTDALEIYQIEISDTALLLKGDAYNRPDSWVSLSSESFVKGVTTGKIYKLIRSYGFPLDEKNYMPESGNMPFILQFEFLDPKEEAIHFMEGDSDDDFQLRDIQLVKTQSQKGFTCLIEGEVVDRPQSSRLAVIRRNGDLRTSPFISIPIRDGKFSYPLNVEVEEAYDIIFWDEHLNGSWYVTTFIAEPATLFFTFNSGKKDKHYELKTEGSLNRELTHITTERDSLYSYDLLFKEKNRLGAENRIYNEVWQKIQEKIETTNDPNERDNFFKVRDRLEESGEGYTNEGKEINQRIEDLTNTRNLFVLNYAKENPGITGFYLLKELIRRNNSQSDLLQAYTNVYETVYQDKYPDHPYTEQIETVLLSNSVKVGGKYIDFTAPDLSGNLVTLSGQIKGKVALIDLWASWCGPCRRTSISMIPVYEEFKEKGFVIVGIAREQYDTNAMKKAIEKDKYPWLNLVELNDEGKIWEKYGVGNSGGSTFLVDTDGTILAIYPKADEVRRILSEKLL